MRIGLARISSGALGSLSRFQPFGLTGTGLSSDPWPLNVLEREILKFSNHSSL